MRAAVENGADAVYFGLRGHNARARAVNFDDADLRTVMTELHRRGVRGYITLNTLVFSSELEELERVVRMIAEAGVDAVIVQDLGLARLIRAVTPDLEIHASTQMSITSEEGIRLAEELGCSRVILARELSLSEIDKIKTVATLPVEVFVHGALCVAYSGQCLTSEALGGRSANRGECAQACRMPYEIVSDGILQDLGATKFLLSPQDLAAYDLVPRLIELGVASLKIEGRLKTPEYVANITRHYRTAIDTAWAGGEVTFTPRDQQEMELSFSRGFSHGFFDGNDHKVLVRGDYAKKRGIFLGRVSAIQADRVKLTLAAPIKKGDGVVFDGDDQVIEQGGRVYQVEGSDGSERPGGSSAGTALLGFGRNDLDLKKLQVGQRIWKTDDPQLTRRLQQSYEGAPRRLVKIDFQVRAVTGEQIQIQARSATGFQATATSDHRLETAIHQPTTRDLVTEQLGRLGGTIYEVGEINVLLEGTPIVPKSVLNQLRRDLIEKLDREAATSHHPARIAEEAVLPRLRGIVPARSETNPILSALCRSTPQLVAAARAGVTSLYAEFQDIKLYSEAISAARAEGAKIYLATPRIEKPGEAPIFRYLEKQQADGLLVRNAGGIAFCAETSTPFVTDFSLNATNELTVEFLLGKGAERVTASYDLSVDQLEELLKRTDPEKLEIVIHQRIPMFHMEHCVFCAFLSPGTDHTNCGRPCDVHDVKLRDRVGIDHPLKADIGCRNTLYNAVPQSAGESLERLRRHGAQHLRIEFLDEGPEEVAHIVQLYRDAIEGRRDSRKLWKDLKATNQYGVTRGALAILR